MRCSWFEPHFGRFRDGTLKAPKMRRMAEHLEACSLCSALMAEMEVVDALLVTAKTSPLPPNFTSAVMSGVRATSPHETRPFSLWSMLALYVPIAWIAAMIALHIPALHAAAAGSSLNALRTIGLHNLAEIIGTTHAFAPTAPLVIAAVLAVLALDLAALGGLIAYHHRMHVRVPVRSTSETL